MSELTCLQCHGLGKIEVNGKLIDCEACDGTGNIPRPTAR
jgi:hypothetical protein